MSIIYPLDRLGRNLLFDTFDELFDTAMRKSNNFFKNGNFKATHTENSYTIKSTDIIKGKIPDDINGVYIRNGPNPLYTPENNRAHFFDGDSMLHAFRISNGHLFYFNKWIQTDR